MAVSQEHASVLQPAVVLEVAVSPVAELILRLSVTSAAEPSPSAVTAALSSDVLVSPPSGLLPVQVGRL